MLASDFNKYETSDRNNIRFDVITIILIQFDSISLFETFRDVALYSEVAVFSCFFVISFRLCDIVKASKIDMLPPKITILGQLVLQR